METVARDRKPINVTLDPKLVERLDEWLARRPYKTTRASFIEVAIQKLLDEEEGQG